MDKKIRNKIMKMSGTVYPGYSKEYERLIFDVVIDNPSITSSQLSITHLARKVPRILNDYISQKYIDIVNKEVNE